MPPPNRSEKPAAQYVEGPSGKEGDAWARLRKRKAAHGQRHGSGKLSGDPPLGGLLLQVIAAGQKPKGGEAIGKIA